MTERPCQGAGKIGPGGGAMCSSGGRWRRARALRHTAPHCTTVCLVVGRGLRGMAGPPHLDSCIARVGN